MTDLPEFSDARPYLHAESIVGEAVSLLLARSLGRTILLKELLEQVGEDQ